MNVSVKMEKIIEETLNSINHIGKVDANPFLYEKIKKRLLEENNPPTYPLFYFSSLKLVMAILVLLFINIFTLVYLQPTDKNTEVKMLIEEYSLYDVSND